MSDIPTTITFAPPLPCCTVQGDRICGKPATTGTLHPWGSAGIYIVQPFCEDCVRALVRVYGIAPAPLKAPGDDQ